MRSVVLPQAREFFDSSLPILFWVKGGLYGRFRREIVGRGFALFGAAQFNLFVNIGRKAGRDARGFFKGAQFFLRAAFKMLYHFLLHFGGKVSRYEMPGLNVCQRWNR